MQGSPRSARGHTPCYNRRMPTPDFEQQVLTALARLTNGQARLEEGQEELRKDMREVKEHLAMQDAYLKQSFDRITDMLGYEERIAELERQVAALRQA